MTKKIWKWTKVSLFSFMALVAMMGAVCSGTMEGTMLCVGLSILAGGWGLIEAILDVA